MTNRKTKNARREIVRTPLNQTTLFHSHPHHRPPIQNIQNRTSPYTLKTPTASPYVLAADKSTGLPVHYRLQTTGLPAYF